VHAIACNLDGTALNAREVFVQVRPRVEVADGAEVESDSREQREGKQQPESPLDPLLRSRCDHGLASFLFQSLRQSPSFFDDAHGDGIEDEGAMAVPFRALDPADGVGVGGCVQLAAGDAAE